ncbi:MAG: hypothetical protein AAFV93_09325, partial [Chloroflexota bacterium]
WVEGNTVLFTDSSGMQPDCSCEQFLPDFPDLYSNCLTGNTSRSFTHCEQFLNDLRDRINGDLSNLGCNPNGDYRSYSGCKRFNTRRVALDLAEYYSAMRFENGISVLPDAIERWPVENVGGIGIGAAHATVTNPLLDRDDLHVGVRRRTSYGFSRPFFQNTHHFFALFGIAMYYNSGISDLIDAEREREGLCLEAKSYCRNQRGENVGGAESIDDYRYFYVEAAIDRYITQLATEFATIVSNLDISFLPDLLESAGVCANSESQIWRDYDGILENAAEIYSDWHPDDIDSKCDEIMASDCDFFGPNNVRDSIGGVSR